MDVDPITFNMDVGASRPSTGRTPRMAAMIPVHLYGGCADMDPLCDMAGAHGVRVIEDFAQAIGVEYKGRRVGSIGDIGTLSFYPQKTWAPTATPECSTTNDEALATKLAALREHGCTETYFHKLGGFNSAWTPFKRRRLRVKFRYLDGWTAGRRQNAALYGKLPAASRDCSHSAAGTTRHIFNQFVIRCPQRDRLRAH